MDTPDPPTAAQEERPSLSVTTGIGALLAAAGALGVIGWHTGSTLLVNGVLDFPPLRYDTALGLILAGAGLLGRRRRRVLSLTSLGLACLTLVGILQMLLPAGAWPQLPGGRMSPLSVAELGVASAGLLLLLHLRPGLLPRLGVCGAMLLILGVSGLFDLLSQFPMHWAWEPLVERSLYGSLGWTFMGGALLIESSRGGKADHAPARRLALVTGLAVLGVMFGLWQAMVAQERRRVHRRVSAHGDRVVADVEHGLRQRMTALERMSDRRVQPGHAARERWELDAESYLEPPLAFASIHWVDPSLARKWSVPAPSPLLQDPSLIRALKNVAESGITTSTRPIEIGDRAMVAACAPVLRDGALQGILIGLIDVRRLFQTLAIQEERVGFAFRVFSPPGTQRYVSDTEIPADRWERWGRIHPVPLVAELTTEIVPRDSALRRGRSLLPEVTLGLGVLLALALAQMVYLAQERTARSRELSEQVLLRRSSEAQLAEALQDLQAQANALAETNVQLQQEAAIRERFERELGRQAAGLKRAARRLAASNAELEQFAYVAAHDLRSPLRAIANLAQWIEDDLGDALEGETQENLDLLRARVDRMEALLESLLKYSRAGRVKTETEEVSLQEVVEDIQTLLAPPAGIAVEVPEGLPTLETVRVPLEQVLRNLLSNALKHHDRDQGRVALTFRDDGDAVEFRIEDDGPGIDPEFHERIFGMFKTLRSRDRVEGSGMGLALVRRIVQRYGGSIRVESPLADGRGTAFVVRWPKEVHDDEHDEQMLSASARGVA